jgi:tRNA(Ile)-lysidine synthase TilS/MesJ
MTGGSGRDVETIAKEIVSTVFEEYADNEGAEMVATGAVAMDVLEHRIRRQRLKHMTWDRSRRIRRLAGIDDTGNKSSEVLFQMRILAELLMP